MDGINLSNSFMDDPDTSGLNLGDDFFDEDLGDEEHDLDGIFDVESDAVVNSNASSKDGFSKSLEEGINKGSSKGSKDKAGDASNKKGTKSNQKKRRRSSAAKAKDEGDDGQAPAWHSEGDKPYRERMIGEIALLLKARKKSAPTKEWVQQLPHKARVLEDRLYRKAHSMDNYLDRSTLKNRLRTLAVTITAHYKDSVKSRKTTSKRRSTGSVSTLSAEDATHRVSMLSTVSKGTKGASNSTEAQLIQASSRQGTGRDNSIPSSVLGASSNSGAEGKDPNMESSGLTMSELTRQKAVNEELQNQILANIRQQQQIVHIRRESNNSQQGSGGSSSNAQSSGNAQGNSMAMAAAVVAGQMGMSGQFDNMQNANQMQNMPGHSSKNNSQNSQFGGTDNKGGNMQGNQTIQNRRGSTSSMLQNPSQAALLRQQSMPVASGAGSNFNNLSQSALMRQQSMPISAGIGGGHDDMQNAAMQANMLKRSSTTNNASGNQGDFSSPAQMQQLQAQHLAMMNQQGAGGSPGMPMSAQQQQQQQAQMQAEFMRRASQNSAQFNMAQQAQLQAEFMRRASGGNEMQAEFMRRASGGGGGNLMNQQQQAVAAQAQMEMMRRASLGGNQMNGLSNNMMHQTAAGVGPVMGNPGMMNNQMGMGQAFGNNQQQFMQGNAATMMQNMNGGAMPQNMTQFSNLQQQNLMNMAAAQGQGRNQGRNSMISLDGNMQFQGKKGGDDMGVSQNTFNW